MKLIAHRVFDDKVALDDFDPDSISGFHGVEIDVRCHTDGDTFVFHSPVFDPFRRKRNNPTNRLERAIEILSATDNKLQVLFVDIKSVDAAAYVTDFLSRNSCDFQIVFNCWHSDEAKKIRSVFPDASIFFSMAPILTRRLGRILPLDFYVVNHYPFLSRTKKFQPRTEKFNRHNINVRVLARELVESCVPEGFDGICIHKLFLSEYLVAVARAAGLRLAVYGLKTPSDRRLLELGDSIDYAIVKQMKERRPKRRPRALRRMARRLRRLRTGSRPRVEEAASV